MKNVYKISLLVLVLLVLNIVPVYASTNTKERSEQDYLVADWVKVTESNKYNILSTPAVDATEKVYDFADLFTDSEEQQLYTEIRKYIDNHNMDLAVVTINNNNKTPQEYSDDFYDYNDFDQKGGVLFLIDMYNREIYMSTTGSAIKMYNDYRVNQALDMVYKYMSDKRYYNGVQEYISIISNYAYDGIPNNSGHKKSNTLSRDIFMSISFGLLITIIGVNILIHKNKMVRKATTAKEYLDIDSVNIENLGEIVISSNTVRKRIEHDTYSGSSTHSGSSGSSHGGGGHGF